jgi:membrane associated rhomboid family serine protease
MFATYMFGRLLELHWGPRRFFTYYMATGIGAGAFNMLVIYLRISGVEANMDLEAIESVYGNGAEILQQGKNYVNESLGALNLLVNSTTIGASGAVFGVLLAFGMLYPNVMMYIIPIPFPVKAKYVVIGYGVIELFAGVADFSFDHVAHFAHLGGMLFGVAFILYWKKKDRNNGGYYY